jgi:Protein of unknown function (DUF2510)
MAHTPPGWYPDPWGALRQRYFDGATWTRWTYPAGPGSPPQVPSNARHRAPAIRRAEAGDVAGPVRDDESLLSDLVIAKTRRIPVPKGPAGDGAVAARQLDAALMSAGFKLSADLMTALSALSPTTVVDLAETCVLPTVLRLIGDHVQHNVYFKDFPENVPNTLDFWARCISDALRNPASHDLVEMQLSVGVLDLLTLPTYGHYQHTYQEMLDAHDEFLPLVSDRLTIVHLGGTLEGEASRLYLSLAQSPIPLSEHDIQALRALAEYCVTGPQPSEIPIRENRALINGVRMTLGRGLLIDSPTDVLRLACSLSGGDVTLQEPTRFRSLSRPQRRALLAALDAAVRDSPAKLGDIHAYKEAWKRLGERLHPHEHPQWPDAAQVFAVARGEQRAPSLAARIETALKNGDFSAAVTLHTAAPGLFFRSLDRLLRTASCESDHDFLIAAVEGCIGQVSGRVILSVREHLQNRTDPRPAPRIFANRRGSAWVTSDTRAPLDRNLIERLLPILDAEIARRLPQIDHLVVDADLLDVALPLSDKAMPAGFGLLPRGSTAAVDGELLRFFMHWKQTEQVTDFDLSALILDGDGDNPIWLSYTSLTQVGGNHSGDITDAPDGATEFIDLELGKVDRRFIIPQVNVYSGEGFEEVQESFFGFMLRDREQRGKPFDPRTVRMKSDLRGPNRVALPLVFFRDDTQWRVRWMHLFLRGRPAFNRVEENRVSTWQTVAGIMGREYLTVRYLVSLLAPGKLTILHSGDPVPDGAVTHLGLDTLASLKELIPA